jgi:acetoin utilization deacetylase AcuC-like enzyme
MLVLYTERFEEHQTPPGHPESPARAEVLGAVVIDWRREGGLVREPKPATREHLARVHSDPYLDLIASTAGRSVALDPDTFTSPASHDVALIAAGAVVDAVDYVLAPDGVPGSRVPKACALVRPPGHHAERDRAMGFCLYNNAAVAAAHARARGCERVAVVDFDVHHGNGTQWIFYDDPSVLYVSTHQYPFYPGTGAADDAGVDAGRGYTLNVPLEAGATDADYDAVFKRLIVPVLTRFGPDLLVVSAGFDAHERDPLAGMRMSTGGFANLTQQLCDVADECCRGRAIFVTEGGYHLPTLAACALTTLEIAAGQTRIAPYAAQAGDARRSRETIAAVRAAHSTFWPTI